MTRGVIKLSYHLVHKTHMCRLKHTLCRSSACHAHARTRCVQTQPWPSLSSRYRLVHTSTTSNVTPSGDDSTPAELWYCAALWQCHCIAQDWGGAPQTTETMDAPATRISLYECIANKCLSNFNFLKSTSRRTYKARITISNDQLL